MSEPSLAKGAKQSPSRHLSINIPKENDIDFSVPLTPSSKTSKLISSLIRFFVGAIKDFQNHYYDTTSDNLDVELDRKDQDIDRWDSLNEDNVTGFIRKTKLGHCMHCSYNV